MFSKILIKLVDQAIVPALLLIVVRVASVTLIAQYNGIPFELTSSGFTFNSQTDYILINSYSTFAMILVISLGLLYSLLKAYVTHSTHISPVMTAKLFSMRLSSFIQSSFDIYSQGSIWLSYSYLLVMVSGVFAFFGFMYTWVFITSLVLTLLCTVLFILDIEEELISENPIHKIEEVVHDKIVKFEDLKL